MSCVIRDSNISFFIDYINNAVRKFLIYITSHMRIAEQGGGAYKHKKAHSASLHCTILFRTKYLL